MAEAIFESHFQPASIPSKSAPEKTASGAPRCGRSSARCFSGKA